MVYQVQKELWVGKSGNKDDISIMQIKMMVTGTVLSSIAGTGFPC